MKIIKFKLFESPNDITIYDKKNKAINVSYWDCLTKAFGYLPKLDEDGKVIYELIGKKKRPKIDKMWVGEPFKGHGSCQFLKDNELKTVDLVFKGRLWFSYRGKDMNIISFWDTEELDQQKMQTLINDLEKIIDEDLSKWKIDNEIFVDIKKVTKLIPLKDYDGGIKFTKEMEEEMLWHLMNAEEKEKAKKAGKFNVPTGLGSRKFADKVLPAEYKNKTTKYRFTENIQKFSDYK